MTVSASMSLAGAIAALSIPIFVASGCSSSAAPPLGGAGDSGKPVSSATPGDDAGVAVGDPCATTADCPSGDQCSNTVYAAGNPLFPTPICVAACAAGDPSQGILYCGGDSLPGEGLCQPSSDGGQGLCLPLCEVTPAGTVVGCEANDVCQVLGSSAPDGVGWCQPGCTATAQCPAGSVCDPLLAACVASPMVATLPIGASCSFAANPSPCSCIGTATGTTGYCTAACVTGATACPSPPLSDGGATAIPDGGEAGAPAPSDLWVCSAGLSSITDADGGVLFATQPAGLFGFCTPPCNTDADCASFSGICAHGDPAAPAGFTGTCVTAS